MRRRTQKNLRPDHFAHAIHSMIACEQEHAQVGLNAMRATAIA
jgi:hypothetical protein